jgi:hypothetical protein
MSDREHWECTTMSKALGEIGEILMSISLKRRNLKKLEVEFMLQAGMS